MADKNYNDILLEDINSKFDAILEAAVAMQDNVKRIPDIDERVKNLEDEVRAVRLATSETNADVKDVKALIQKVNDQLNEFESRLSAVESA